MRTLHKMRRGLALVTTTVPACVLGAGASAQPAPQLEATVEHRQAARTLAARKCLPRPRFQIRPARTIPVELRSRTLAVARRVHVRLQYAGLHCDPLGYQAFRRSPAARLRLSKWLCIHYGEGPWNANTGNGYYGGLQMDLRFQRSYGRDALRRYGLAHRWPWWTQILVADRAYRSGRGFYPWPTTARRCGLI